MLLGAVGLTGAWAAAPKGPPMAQPPTPSPAAAATLTQVRALQQAASADHAALAGLLVQLGAPAQLASSAPALTLTTTAVDAVTSLKQTEAGMVVAADQDAQQRISAAKAVLRATGLDTRPYMTVQPTAAVSPLELRNPRVLAVRLDVDPDMARQVQHTARDLMAARSLAGASAALPLATPVDNPVRSSPFGFRTDPFTHEIAFHPGQDFAGNYGQAIHVTAPGVVSFVGQRSGYGNCVEVDHGYGFKTRYGHLSAFGPGVGQVVKTGDVIGRMGSTGRSTGVHLHYEVWASGRLLNPAPFLNAGARFQKG